MLCINPDHSANMALVNKPHTNKYSVLGPCFSGLIWPHHVVGLGSAPSVPSVPPFDRRGGGAP